MHSVWSTQTKEPIRPDRYAIARKGEAIVLVTFWRLGARSIDQSTDAQCRIERLASHTFYCIYGLELQGVVCEKLVGSDL